MNIEIIKNPSGSYAIYNGDELISDGWRTKNDAEVQAAGHARRIAAAALGSAKTPAKAAAARENGRKGGRPKSPYSSTFHRDGSVTIWDVYRQGWERTANPSDDQLASLSPEERKKVIAHTA